MNSKLLVSEEVQIKVHYDYHGCERCTPVFVDFEILAALSLEDFMDYLRNEIPYLTRKPQIRLCFMDNEKHWVDLTSQIYPKFIKSGSHVNIKVLDGMSPATPVVKDSTNRDREPRGSKRHLEFPLPINESDEASTKWAYKSPMEVDIEDKKDCLREKELELSFYKTKYDRLDMEYNPKVPRGSRNLCHKCHGREGHTKTKCPNLPCQDILSCGELDMHPDKKKELQEMASLKNKCDAEVKKLKSELEVKKNVYQSVAQSFESKIHSYLIRTNPSKYLVNGVGPEIKKRVLDADKCILRNHYGGKAPDHLEIASCTWQSIIDAFHDKYKLQNKKICPPQNPILERLKSMKKETLCAPKTPEEEESQLNSALAMSFVHQGLYMYPSHPYNFGYPGYSGPYVAGVPYGNFSSPPPRPPTATVTSGALTGLESQIPPLPPGPPPDNFSQ